jgi:hypothetical protein
MPFTPTTRFNAVITAIDAVNGEDPRKITVNGTERPFETVYADRMTETLARLYPDASELLRIAARAQAHADLWAHHAHLVGLIYMPFRPAFEPEALLRRLVVEIP